MACLAMALLALTGCAAVEVRLGSRVYLDKIPMSSMQASFPQGGIAPGEKSPLVAVLTDPAGKQWVTEGAGHGKILWKDLAVAATVVTVNQKGVVSLSDDPRLSDGKVGHVTITAPSHPDLHADLDIPVRYDHNFAASFSGASGSNGSDGSNGIDGSSGSMGSLDPNNPSAGGNGSDGTAGSDGGNAGDGGNGPAVQVRVTLRSGTHPLLQVGVSAAGREKFYLVDPQGGSLTVKSLGGQGGSGGKGGRGGRGGSGGTGTPNGNSGSDGSSGHDGSNGSDGKGGSITVTCDPQAQPYLTAIKLSNPGGPAPSFQQAPVAPLW